MRGVPVVASLLGHAALIALLSTAGSLAGLESPPETPVIPVGRAPDSPSATGPRMRLESPERSEPEAVEEAVVALDTLDPHYRPYLALVKRRIWECWSEPEGMEGRSVRGTLVVEFTLTRSGRLAESVVRHASGVPALDRAALAAVVSAEPFPPLPATIAGEALHVRARFVYD